MINMKINYQIINQLNNFYSFSYTNNNNIYIKNPYIIFVKQDNQYLSYNVLTDSYFILSEEEYNIYQGIINLKPPISFFQNYFFFFLSEQKELINLIYNIINNLSKELSIFATEPSIYILILTTNCNAKCNYCYEACYGAIAEEPCFLNENTADKIIQLIIKNYKKNKKKVALRWFGGEPLLNYKIINYISKTLYENKIPMESVILTNGLLFNEFMYEESIKNHWNLKLIQFPIDGYENLYNEIKNYKNKNIINPFSQIIKNLKFLYKKQKNSNLIISIRLNLTLTNKEDLKKVILYLKQEDIFQDCGIYCATLYNLLGNEEYTNIEKQQYLKDFKEISEFINTLKDNNFNSLKTRSKYYEYAYRCSSEYGGTLVFLPDGTISPCEHFQEHLPFTNIDFLNYKNFQQYCRFIFKMNKTKFVYPEECQQCKLYPSCNHNLYCKANDGKCNTYIIQKEVFLKEQSLKLCYKEYLYKNNIDN